MRLLEKTQKKVQDDESSIIFSKKKLTPPKEAQWAPVNTETISQTAETIQIPKPEPTTPQPDRNLPGHSGRNKTNSKHTQTVGKTANESLVKPPQKKTETAIDEVIQKSEKNIEVLEKQTGFGWKKQGSKRIIYDRVRHETRYEVHEPKGTAQ